MEGQWTDSALRILRERYLQTKPDGSQETPKDMLLRVAGAIALADKEYGADDPDVEKIERAFFKILVERRFIPNSPTLMNAGLGSRLQYSACYVLPVEDSICGIFESIKNAADVHRSGGGTGFSFSRLRPNGNLVSRSGGIASGPVSFMRVFDAATEAIKQGGRRRGANMGVLRVDHPDIEEFITCKLEGGITNFNISVGITEAFMNALERSIVQPDANYALVSQPGWPNHDGSKNRGGEVIGHKNARYIWNMIVDAAWETGDPGLLFMDRINKSPANPTPFLGPIETTNPCVTGDTMIFTENGLVEIRTLYHDGTPVRVTSDHRQGTPLYQQASHVFLIGEKQVFKLSTKEGYSLRLTANHKIMTDHGWVEAKKLWGGDKIHILNRKGGFGNYGSREAGLTIGWLVGDGTISEDRAILYFYDKDKALAPMFAEMVSEMVEGIQKLNRPYSTSVIEGPERNTVKSVRLLRVLNDFGVRNEDKHRVPKAVFAGTEAMQRGFLQAFFSADGTVTGKTSYKGASVRLAQSNTFLLEQVQMLLLNFGIASKIYKNRRNAGYRKLPDGKGGLKEYYTKAQHELIISKANMVTFLQEIGFISPDKQEKLEEALAAYESKGPYKENFTVRFESLIPDGIEEVFDLNEPVTHSFVGGGMVVHNCGEQPLYPNEACNLGSINLAEFAHNAETIPGATYINWDGLKETIKLAVRFLDNVITVNPYPLPEIDEVVKKNRRIGVGVMGWADMLYILKIPYNSEKALELAEKIMLFIKETGHEESFNLAQTRGVFPNWDKSIYKNVGMRRNSAITTIAPTGSISIIAGVSSGVEPLFALAYRHISKTPEGERVLTLVNPIFERELKKRGLWSEALMERVMQHGSIRDFEELPADLREVFVTAHEIEPDWHVRMQGAFQKYTDNGVSKTVNLPHDATRQDIEAAYLLAYDVGCLGVTVFRDGSKGAQVLNVGPAPESVKIRPTCLNGNTYRKKTPVGTCYITINEDMNGGPFEVFVNVGKAGSAIAANAEAIGRLISSILRMPGSSSPYERTQSIIGQLRGIGSGRTQGFGPDKVLSLSDAISQVLAVHIGLESVDQFIPGLPEMDESSNIGDLCPECGHATFVREEGCQKCYGCGYSEC